MNDRTRPPLDVLTEEIDRHWLEQGIETGTAYCSCGAWSFDAKVGRHPLPTLGEHFAPFSKHVAEVVAAAYQPTGPDDLAGLPAVARDAYAAMDAATRWAATQRPASDSPSDVDAHLRGYDALLDAQVRLGQALGVLSGGVTLTGVRSSEVDGLREERLGDGPIIGPLTPKQVRILRHRHHIVKNSRMCACGQVWAYCEVHRLIETLAALTGDTGPKVEPEPPTSWCFHCGSPVGPDGDYITATPEPSNDD